MRNAECRTVGQCGVRSPESGVGGAWTRISILLLIAHVAVAATTQPARPNIVFVFTDDQAPGMTGYEGNVDIKTPNLDRLASESSRFMRCYAPTPQCAPSRASVLTGMYPHRHGVTTNGGLLPVGADTIASRLTRAGYACGVVGKWHLPPGNAARPGLGFDAYSAMHGEGWAWRDSPVWVNGEERKADKYLTDWDTDRAIEFIEQSKDQPFFLWLCYNAPHTPLDYPPETESLYPPEGLTIPDVVDAGTLYPGQLQQSVPVAEFRKLKSTPDELRRRRSKYYAMITQVDRNVGRLLEQLTSTGVAENTVVIFASDNGWALGENALYSKGPLFVDALARVPMLIRDPRRAKGGATVDRVVSLVDLAPTILEIAGLEPPPTMHGRSLTRLLDDRDDPRHVDECFLEYDKQKGKEYQARGIVTANYKFVDYQREVDMMFDLQRDPDETRNVANDPVYTSIVTVLRSRLEAWRKQTRDPQTWR